MVRKVGIKVLFSGNVQGVGFRYRTEGLARDYDVYGYVKNLVDGRVELLAEGEADEVRRFIGSVEKALSHHIRNKVEDSVPVSGFVDL